MTGTIDGRSFYLRDRRCTYRLSGPTGPAQADPHDDPAAPRRVLEERPGDWLRPRR
jgi:hypothetical protein